MVAQTSSLAVVEPPPVPSRRVAGLAVGLASALAFSSSGPVVKPLIEAGWTLGAALLVRMSLAALILSPALIRAVRRRSGLLGRQWPLIVGFGLTGVAGCQIFYFAAMQRMPVAVALLVQYLAPVLLVLLAWVRTRRAPSRLVLTGSAVAILALVLVVDIAGARFDLLGTIFALGAAVCVGAYFLLSERTGEELPPLALAAGGLIVGAALMAALCATGLLPFSAPDVSVVLAGFELPAWVAIGWVGAVATTLGYSLGVIAVPMLGSRVASFVGLSEVLFALLFAWLLLGEAPGPVQIVGGAVLIVGVVLVRMDASAPSVQATAASAAAAPSP
ncbi:EamA family transporter [Microbacterium sp. RG1]|uniref:EamA family transporter n=1 Tax=Microbacterium sp. RG1 TaxID=2489212 RepID=UPI0010CA509F|nr:DMT family transporter [Microbacterium sp. RG1]QCQ16061.1 EamA/RhaT family transporter [Microbacterium sp. RG1]